MEEKITKLLKWINKYVNIDFAIKTLLCFLETPVTRIIMTPIKYLVPKESLLNIAGIIICIIEFVLIIYPNSKQLRDTGLYEQRTITKKTKYISKKAIKILSWVLLMIICNILLASIMTEIGKLLGYERTINLNQQAFNEALDMNWIIMIFYAGIIGPCAEEITFRYCIKNLFKNKKFSRFVASLCFVAGHIGSLEVNELLVIPVYFGLAMILMTISDRNKDLNTNIWVHGVFNTLIIMISYAAKMI